MDTIKTATNDGNAGTVTTSLSQDDIRLEGVVSSLPFRGDRDGREVWAWDYYRPRAASQWARHVTVNLDVLDGSGIVGLMRVTGTGEIVTDDWREFPAGSGLPGILEGAKEGIYSLLQVPVHKREVNPAMALLYDNGFQAVRGGKDGRETHFVRDNDQGMTDVVRGLAEFSDGPTRTYLGRPDPFDVDGQAVEVCVHDGKTSAETVTACPGIEEAIAVLNNGFVPAPEGGVTTMHPWHELVFAGPSMR